MSYKVHFLIGYLVVFLARTLDISLATMRILMILHGRRLMAAVIGFFESLIFISVLTYVLKGLDDIPSLIFYALGFATGNYLGLFVEDKIAIGDVTVQIISKKDSSSLVEDIRRRGFGVTVLEGCGRDGTRQVLMVYLHRRDTRALMEMVEEFDQGAVITVLDTRKVMGGHFARKKIK